LSKFGDGERREVGEVWWEKMRDIWDGVKLGWESFIYESTLYKISLNIYILREYLKIGTKSL
jgi:hypothetical protein